MAVEKYSKEVVNKVIAYAFTIGVIVALVLGLVSAMVPANVVPYLISVMVLAGVAVGFFNISPRETRDYVLFVTALVIVTSMSGDTLSAVQYVGPYLESVLASIMAFIVPSVIIVGIKAIINLAKD
jgi:hypothetical protein